ncbi:hypothetical protein DNTS_018068 [Danionella cerebrum]|uniref:G-protein coupled receptors family 1 profile domain-containing protein n=1 Tax=Danionella cerebrum TaxID=2873325 RepID=A0A553QGS9_9TELE|nr:hypothetical protein DNTS_018068 [Danionella translucida]
MDELNSTWDYESYSPVVAETGACSTIDINKFGKAFLPPFYSVIFIISILGNGVVLLVLYKFEKLNSVTNIFLINLVASNLIFSFTLPFQAVYHSGEWVFGEALCKAVHGAYYLGFYSSILFLTLMTFDRYLAVVHSMVANRQRRGCYASCLSLAIWFVSFLASLEYFVHFTVEEYPMAGLVCEDQGEEHWLMFSFYKQIVLFFLFPLAVFVYCYMRITLTVMATRMAGKHRTIRLVFVIVLMFFVFWSPYNIVLMIDEFKVEEDCGSSLPYVRYIASNLARLYFCISPVLYTFLGRKFQNHARGVLASHFSCLASRLSISSSSRSLA